MRKLMVLIAFVLTISAVAHADTVWLTFENVDPKNISTDGKYYVYPYNFAITPGSSSYVAPTGTPSLTSLICDDYHDQVFLTNPAEYWKANVYTGSDIYTYGQMPKVAGGGLQPITKKAYEDAAWLFLQLSGPNDSNAAIINETIWAIFDSTTPYNSLVSTEFALAELNSSSTDLSQVVLYTPISDTQSIPNQPPQEFFGRAPTTVPEPSSLLLLGSGLLGFCFKLRRKALKNY